MKTNRVQRGRRKEEEKKYERTGREKRKERQPFIKATAWETTGRVYRFTEISSVQFEVFRHIFLNIIIAHSCFSLHSLSASCTFCISFSIVLLLCIRKQSIYGAKWVNFHTSHSEAEECFVEFAIQEDMSENVECLFLSAFFHSNNRSMGKLYTK